MVYWQRSGTFCAAAEQFYRARGGGVLLELAASAHLGSERGNHRFIIIDCDAHIR